MNIKNVDGIQEDQASRPARGVPEASRAPGDEPAAFVPAALAPEYSPRVGAVEDGLTTVEVGPHRFRLHASRCLERELVEGRLFEPESVGIVRQIVRAGDTVLDVGANFGYYTILLSEWTGPAGTVIAFEPTREYGARNEAHLRANGVGNVVLVGAGLSDHAHTTDIHIGECSGTMHWTAPTSPRATEAVELLQLDEWWRQRVAAGMPDRLDFLKIDVDGHELHALRGAAETLRRHRPALLVAFHAPNLAHAGYSCADLADMLEALGYTLYDQLTGRPYPDRLAFLAAVDRPDLSVNVFCLSAEGVARLRARDPRALFGTPNDVYLASADRMDRVLSNVDALRADGICDVETFASVVGGLSGLNYLTAVTARRIVFFDINPAAVEYARMVIELIAMAESPDEFISRVFGRSVDAFVADSGGAGLSTANQEAYLSRPLDRALQADTLSRLSDVGRRAFQTFLEPLQHRRELDGVRNCRRLLPCWPIDERVPVGAGEALGCDQAGRLVPNTNTFFLGHGWLASASTFTHVREVLATAAVQFRPFDLLRGTLEDLAPLSRAVLLHVSNIDEWFPSECAVLRTEWEALAIASGCRLTVVSSHSGVLSRGADPHAWALAAITPHVAGRVVEVTHRVPWGFHEFARVNVTADEYLVAHADADTTILHILLGEGVSPDEFVAVCRRALTSSRRVIVLEHDRTSADWAPPPPHLVDEWTLRDLIERSGVAVPLKHVEHVRGDRDDRRNILLVFEREGTANATKAEVTGAPLAAAAPAHGLGPRGGARPRVLLIADVPNWIFARHCETLRRLLGHRFDFTVQFQGHDIDEDRFDLIYPLEFNLVTPDLVRTPAKYVTGIRSHISWRDEPFLPLVDRLVSTFQRVHVVSERLLRLFAPFLPGVTCISHGVDTAHFSPSSRTDQSGPGRIRLGWAGNRINRTKGFERYIAPLATVPGVELRSCGFLDENRGMDAMPAFYDSLDVYVCSSSVHHEGNNNSLLEAAAMERAIVTTDNGAVPEYLVDGRSALVVQPELPAFLAAVLRLRDDPALRRQLGLAAREAVMGRFEWIHRAQDYAAFFEEAIANRDGFTPRADVAARVLAQPDGVAATDPVRLSLPVVRRSERAGRGAGPGGLATMPGERVGVFGASSRGRQCLAALEVRSELSVVCFFDNDPAKCTQEYQGLPVLPPVPASLERVEAIVIASQWEAEILGQLDKAGWSARGRIDL